MLSAESWISTGRWKSMITATKMKYQQKSTGSTRRDRIRNENIREQLGQGPIIVRKIAIKMLWSYIK